MFYRLNKYGEFNNYDLFKNIAFFLMLIDHLGLFLFPQLHIMRVVGRVAFPIYAILHGISFKNNSSKPTLLIYGSILQFILFYFFAFVPFPFYLFVESRTVALNILFNFFISGLLFNYLYKHYQDNKLLSFIILFLTIPLYYLTHNIVEYGIFALVFMLVGKNFYKIGSNLGDIFFNFVIFAFYIYLQSNVFGIYGFELFIFIILMFALFIGLYNFDYREYYHIKSNKFLLFISRYGLELYVISTAILAWLFVIKNLK